MSFPVVVPCIDLMFNISSPRMKMASCAMSIMSVLSSTAREYAIKFLLLSHNCVLKSVAISQTRSAIVFLLRLTFAKICVLSGHKTSHTFIMQLFRVVNGRADLAISSATIKLAFTTASLCHYALVKKVCWNVRFFFRLLLSVVSALHLGFSAYPDVLSRSAVLN